MRAALLDLVERAGDRRRVAILGEMAELGADVAGATTTRSARSLDELGIELVIAIGDEALPLRPGAGPARPPLDFRRRRVRATSPGLLHPGDAILVKASRAVGLEGIPASIEKRAGAWSAS